MRSQSKAYLYALLAVLCWSTVATAFKLSLAYLSPAQLLLIANITSCAVLGLILLMQGKLPTLFQQTPKVWLTSVGFGLVNPFLYYLILFKAYQLLPAQEAQAINYSWAITMTLLAVPLLRQPLRLRDLAAALLCYVGVLVIATHGQVFSLHFSNTTGLILALLSTLLWASYWILNTKDSRPPVLGLLLNFLCALPFIVLYCALTGEFTHLVTAGIWGAIYVGVFEMGLTFVLWLNALKYTDSTAKVSNLIFISPFLSLLFIQAFLGEKILISTFYGLLLIIIGLGVQQWHWRK